MKMRRRRRRKKKRRKCVAEILVLLEEALESAGLAERGRSFAKAMEIRAWLEKQRLEVAQCEVSRSLQVSLIDV